MSTVQDFTGYKPTWCPGCGNWGIGMSLKMAFVEMGMMPSSVMISFGIGCSGNMNDFVNGYAMHGLHGRAIATAVGMKLANHKMPVCAVVGDGDCYGEGGNHFLHACRGNHDIKVLIHDNRVYGLTTGQVSPMAEKGQKSKSTPSGIIETPVDPLALAITQGASFVAQTFAGDTKHMVETIKKAFAHTGFAVVNVLQPCVTFDKKSTYQYYMQHVYKLDASYNPGDKMAALAKGSTWSHI
jgi:2-oxoglutarate ferredoxin oxidoreductase subunit beta